MNDEAVSLLAGKRGVSGGNVGWNARVDRACSIFGGVCLALASTFVAAAAATGENRVR